MSLADDAALVARFRAGDGKGFELLVARHTRYAGAVALSVVGDYHAALDVVQEAFLKALEGIWTLENPERFRSWLRNVVRTTALDYLRRRKVVGRSGERLPGQGESDSQPLPSEGLGPEEALEHDELRALIRDEVVALPETQREVVYLKYLEGLSYEEIADTTGLTINTIESRLFRARGRLRERLGRHLDLGNGNEERSS
ncbi:MAG: sigma-70 family RNA polymerase sigma factor [Planctomycetes bacterium]|nr:sigma-70 family RNA polymerase sigma factor [Planctomycetota bacterium]